MSDATGSETARQTAAPDLKGTELGRLLVLAGPTAVGKSEVALLLAERLGGEIVSVDSMQVYRGLDIGTAKPTPAERERVPHHLIDIIEVTEPFDAAQFVCLAREAVSAIQARGRVPILCGGTGLYFQALFEGLGEAPTDPALRAELEQTPIAALLQELAERDPVAYERIDRQNPRRIFRAVEVIRLTGRPFSEQRAQWGQGSRAQTAGRPFYGLQRSTEDLRRRIDVRVDEMFRRGLVEETQLLLERGLGKNRNAMQALGYRQVIEHLEGRRPLPETIEQVKIRTRRFAKRQMTWFCGQMRLKWVPMESHTSAEAVAEQLAAEADALLDRKT